jgi:hypothetical protein
LRPFTKRFEGLWRKSLCEKVTKNKINLTTFPTISGHPLHEIKDEQILVSDRAVECSMTISTTAQNLRYCILPLYTRSYWRFYYYMINIAGAFLFIPNNIGHICKLTPTNGFAHLFKKK